MQESQKPRLSKPLDHAAYFKAATPEVRLRLEAIQQRVEQLVPDAEHCVSYGMPAFRLGKVFFYFSAFKKHIGIYPPLKESTALVEDLAPYRGPKGNLSFPHNEPLPLKLIGQVAEALAHQYGKTS